MKGVRLPPETSRQQEEDEARPAAAQAATERKLRQAGMEGSDAELRMDVGATIVEYYRKRIEARLKTSKDVDLARKAGEIERTLRVAALSAERDELYRLARFGKLMDELVHALIREIDLQESRFNVRSTQPRSR